MGHTIGNCEHVCGRFLVIVRFLTGPQFSRFCTRFIRINRELCSIEQLSAQCIFFLDTETKSRRKIEVHRTVRHRAASLQIEDGEGTLTCRDTLEIGGLAFNGDFAGGEGSGDVGSDEEQFYHALEVALENGKVSTSLLQRKLSVGFGKAARIIDKMEEMGFVSPPNGQKPREILITMDQYRAMRLRNDE